MPARQLPIFITGNIHKVHMLDKLLGLKLTHNSLDLEEIQAADPAVVIRHKAIEAFEAMRVPVLVDDASLGFDALHGLPGPFIKHFVTVKDGQELLCRMADGLSSRRATAQVHFALYDGNNMQVLHGEVHGTIAQHPKGNGGFAYGWDAIFCPDGYNGKTRAELDEAQYDAVYRKVRPIAELRKLLEEW